MCLCAAGDEWVRGLCLGGPNVKALQVLRPNYAFHSRRFRRFAEAPIAAVAQLLKEMWDM